MEKKTQKWAETEPNTQSPPPEKKNGTQTTQNQILKFLALSNIAPLTLSAIAAQ